jgi:cyclopropane fatty-acyl-phospholipid synthase-like methyltransferase
MRQAAPSVSLASVSAPNSLDFYDSELRAHHEHLRAAHRISPGEDVLDIGCGAGLTTREAGAPRRRAAWSASTSPSACSSAPAS